MLYSRLPILSAFLIGAFPAFAEAEPCTVSGVQGTEASLWRDGSNAALRDGTTLDNNDRIKTGPGTTVRVLCANDVRVTIGPDTEIELGAIALEDNSWSAFLMDGVAWFARPFFSEERFEVRTPSAVASVRSTEWFVEVKEQATAVFVDKGGVEVNASQGGGLVGTGLGIDVSADGIAGPIKTWGAKRTNALRQRLGFPPE